jgi:anti-anti-sigma factor
MMTDGSCHARETAEPGSRIVVVPLPQEIDLTNGVQVSEALAEAIDGGATALIADATSTTFCDCAGLSALARAHHQAVLAGAQLRIAASPVVLRLLELTRTDQLVNAYPTVAAALVHEQICRARQSAPLPPAAD